MIASSSDPNALSDLREAAKADAKAVLTDLGLERYASVERNLLTFLALCRFSPGSNWSAIAPSPIGITPIIVFIKDQFGVEYAPNTRETIRKDSVKALEGLYILIRNADDPGRPTNSPATDYLLDPNLIAALRRFGTPSWKSFASRYRDRLPAVGAPKASRRVSTPVRMPDGKELTLSPGPHSQLIRAILEDWTHHFTPAGAEVAYVGDTADNTSLANEVLLNRLGIDLASSAEKPDVILWYPERAWLIYLEAVHSSGHFDEARKVRLARLSALHHPIYVSCFKDRRAAARFFTTFAAQTEVWIAEEPERLIHFDGERFLGPYR